MIDILRNIYYFVIGKALNCSKICIYDKKYIRANKLVKYLRIFIVDPRHVPESLVTSDIPEIQNKIIVFLVSGDEEKIAEIFEDR